MGVFYGGGCVLLTIVSVCFFSVSGLCVVRVFGKFCKHSMYRISWVLGLGICFVVALSEWLLLMLNGKW